MCNTCRNKKLPLQRRQPVAEAEKMNTRDPQNRPRLHGSYSTREDKGKSMLEMNGRMDKWAREHADNPVIQVLGQQHIFDMLSNGDALQELEAIRKHVCRRLDNNKNLGFFDIALDVFALGYIYGKREERSRKASAVRSGRVQG